MMQTFRNLGIGLTLAVIIIYFMMVALDKSFLVPLCVLVAVPLILIGVWPTLFLTGTSLNVQSLIGIIFSVGIKVANTVLMTDVAQELRKNEGLSPVAGDPQGGRDAGPPGHDDGAGGVLRHDPDGAGTREGERGERPARPGDPRRPDRRRAGHALRRPRAVLR